MSVNVFLYLAGVEPGRGLAPYNVEDQEAEMHVSVSGGRGADRERIVLKIQ